MEKLAFFCSESRVIANMCYHVYTSLIDHCLTGLNFQLSKCVPLLAFNLPFILKKIIFSWEITTTHIFSVGMSGKQLCFLNFFCHYFQLIFVQSNKYWSEFHSCVWEYLTLLALHIEITFLIPMHGLSTFVRV